MTCSSDTSAPSSSFSRILRAMSSTFFHESLAEGVRVAGTVNTIPKAFQKKESRTSTRARTSRKSSSRTSSSCSMATLLVPKQSPGTWLLLQTAWQLHAALLPPSCPRTCQPLTNTTSYKTTSPSATRTSIRTAWPFNPSSDREFSNGAPYLDRHMALNP